MTNALNGLAVGIEGASPGARTTVPKIISVRGQPLHDNRMASVGATEASHCGLVEPPSPGLWETETVRGLTVRFTALAVLIVVSLSVAIGCSGNRDYDEEVRDAFLTNCEYAGSTPSVCIGALECIEERLTQSDFEYEENIFLLTGEFSERMVEVMARCLKR